MESVLGAGGKPNCLVIDEIDGAPVVGLLDAPVGGQVGGQLARAYCILLAFPRLPSTFF